VKRFDNITVLNFSDTYHETGHYEFKIILHKKKFKNGHHATVGMVNAEGRDVGLDVKKWGRKLNCFFSIEEHDPDGIYRVSVSAQDDFGNDINEEFDCWVVK